MRKLRAIFLRLVSVMRKQRERDEIDAELAAHVAMHTEDGVRAGLTEDEARRRALVRLGGAEQVKQSYRDRQGLPWFESLLQDLRFGIRVLRRNPGFSMVAALTLALGIGANTAIFGLIDALFLKPLAVPHPEQLVRIYAKGPSGHYGADFSLPEIANLRNHASSFSAISADTSIAQLNLAAGSSSVQVRGGAVSANYFETLSIQPALGRWFLAEEDAAPGRNPVAIVGDRLWRVYFHADRTILGREIRINGVPFSVIGVAPAGFHGDLPDQPEEVWFPTMMLGRLGYGCADSSLNCALIETILGRLALGQSPRRAQAEAQSRIVWSADNWPERPSVRQLVLFPARGSSPDDRLGYLAQMRLLIAVTASLLVIACANLAGLLLARGVTRRRELAVRLAIGARRARVVRQLLTESLLLASLGGALGIGFSIAITRLLSRFYETDSEGFHLLYDLSFDWRTLAYSLAITLTLGVLFGLLPAIRASRQELTEELKASGSGAQFTSSRLGNTLVIGQIALSMVLVVSAALLVRSGLGLTRGTNFDPAHVAVFRLRPELLKYSPQQVGSLAQQVTRRLSALPGVESVAYMQGGEGLVWTWQSGRDVQVSLPGETHAAPHAGFSVLKKDIGENFFRTLRTPILQGREFTPQDRTDSPRVAIVNEALAQRLWPARTIVGRTLLVNGQPFQLIGVTANMQPPNPLHAPEAHLYLSYWQSNSIAEGDIRVAVRVAGDATAGLEEMRRAIAAFDPAVPFGEDMAMTEQVNLEYMPVMLARSVLGYCGLLALALSAIGLYSILAFTVRTRTREIGVRMALGARREDVVRLIVTQGARLAAAGVALGVAASLVLTRLEASLLFGVNATDPLTYLGVAVLLIAVALAACLLPARRAASIDPMQALRTE